MFFDENTAKAIDVTNNALRKLSVGSLVKRVFSDADLGDTIEILQIKDIVLGEYSKGFWGYKNIVIPSCTVENVETKEICDLICFEEGGWIADDIRAGGRRYYYYPEMKPFAFAKVNVFGRTTEATLADYSTNWSIKVTALSKLEAKNVLEEMIAKKEAEREAARRAEILRQQQQLDIQRQNDAIKDDDIFALLNKYRNNQ